jgi:hypothetical protein
VYLMLVKLRHFACAALTERYLGWQSYDSACGVAKRGT